MTYAQHEDEVSCADAGATRLRVVQLAPMAAEQHRRVAGVPNEAVSTCGAALTFIQLS